MGIARQRRKNSSIQIAREDLVAVSGSAHSTAMSSHSGSNVKVGMVSRRGLRY